MNTKNSILILLFSILLVACNEEATTTNNNTNVIKGRFSKKYDPSKGGVQIISIQADQDYAGDEWITIKSDKKISLVGWRLNAGDVGQDYTLFSTVVDSFSIYTHTDPDVSNGRDTGLYLSSGKWIWNNSDPDTAKLYNDLNQLVDTMTYLPK